jgi:inward rectifier potassium channel
MPRSTVAANATEYRGRVDTSGEGVYSGQTRVSEVKQQPFDPGITQSFDGRIRRIVNRDGSFNVYRRGARLRDFHLYQYLLKVSWPAFLGIVLLIFMTVNAAFTGLYFAVGIGGLTGVDTSASGEAFLHTYFFSVQTLTTVGYGIISPRGMGANIIASVEAMLGVMGFAFGAGLLYGRFSRPMARILFSSQALVAPYQGGRSLQFRIANLRASALVDLEATVVLMMVEGSGPSARRTYARLELERSTIFFLPLTWTIVHPLDASSPLSSVSPDQLAARSAEIMVLIRGFDDTYNQLVNARSSYRFDEILWGYRFRPAFANDEEGHLVLDLAKIDDVVKAQGVS